MTRRFVLMATLALAWMIGFPHMTFAAAQESVPACASALWLAPLVGTPAVGDAAQAPVAEDAPPWLTIELTDACSGETFALSDFTGKTVYVEAMATWCPPCRDQLARVHEATAQLPEAEREEIVIVVLSSEVDLPREALAEYAASNDFPFIFAVMPVAMLQTMAEDLGQEIAVPPAMPHLIVAPDGTIGELHTGTASPEELLTLFAEAQEAAGS
ncbi:MAG: TlpA family protein disulfide reductase [Chloroflexota bacterium]|nr:TlpA family protein disulfide reductase [Chloroflexota bacterium]